MSGSDKARNKVQRVKGRAKEAIGRAIRDPALEMRAFAISVVRI
jgi:uncharacterized protein YjbJ (UPF0337 family)